MALNRFVVDGKSFDHKKLYEVVYRVTLNLNRIIDINYYPVPEAERSNKRHRPIGIGIQGLADTFFLMGLPYDSDEALVLNNDIFETIYFAALSASKDLAIKDGYYETYPGSPISQDLLQFDLWNEQPGGKYWDWDKLRADIKIHGVRNSLLVAPMPTASTSQILGNNECFEPITSNIYVRRVLSGEFAVVNKYLVYDLIRLGLWNEKMKNEIIAQNGSIQNIPIIADNIKEMYKTVWEVSQKVLINMARGRSPYIDQSQSLNIFMEDPNFGKLSSMHFYGWKLGLKTGMYYLRTRAAVNAVKFTVQNNHQNIPGPEPMLSPKSAVDNRADMLCSIDDPENCLSCSS